MGKVIFGVVLIFLVWAYWADFTDSDNIPYSLSGLKVYVTDHDQDITAHANDIYTSYLDSDVAIKSCKMDATAYADSKNLRDWSYHCCTVTPSNECLSKIK